MESQNQIFIFNNNCIVFWVRLEPYRQTLKFSVYGEL